MLYELRKYTLKVGTMATVLELYGNKGYPAFSAEEKARLEHHRFRWKRIRCSGGMLGIPLAGFG
jgi:hypothetical protein